MNTKAMTAPLITVMVILVFAAITTPVSAQGVEVQIGLVLDGSGSISEDDWDIILDGVASAVEDPNCLPHDGTVELTVVQFGIQRVPLRYHAEVEVPPTVITAANADGVADDIRGIQQGEGYTSMAHGIRLTADEMRGSDMFNPAIKQVLNIATDGVPNVRYENWDNGGVCDEATGMAHAVVARDYAIDELEMNDQDEIDAEGIGIDDDNRDWLKDHIVYPQDGTIAPPYTPGWVRVVEDADEFAESMCEKFEVIIPDDEPCCPDVPVGPGPSGVTGVPILTPLGAVLLIGLLAIAGVGGIRRRRT